MTPDLDHLLGDLWPDVTVGEPSVLSGGFWAEMWRVPVRGQPDHVSDEVVVRRAPSRDMGAKEAEVQRAVAAQGFATPNVWYSGPDAATGGWWSVMDFSPGTSLLEGMDGLAALRRAPSLLRSMPIRLAEAMAALHRVDPAPVTAALADAGVDVAWSITDLLGYYRSGSAEVDRPDLVAAVDELAVTMPTPDREVLCHGDLHPFNVLDCDGVSVVLDWTGSLVADPCFDLAFTELLLRNPPLPLPNPLAPVGRGLGRRMATRLVAAYRRAAPDTSLADLDWYRALHTTRVLMEAATQRAAGNLAHPFLRVAPVVAGELAAFTGVDVRGE